MLLFCLPSSSYKVSSPGAERLLKVPGDLDRFKDMIMRVTYTESSDTRSLLKEGVFLLESVERESGCCIWKLADVKENRDPSAKGRPLSRKQKDWRLKLPYDMFKKVTLFLDYWFYFIFLATFQETCSTFSWNQVTGHIQRNGHFKIQPL